MALYGLAITKEMLWHGRAEEFQNTYYYEGPAEPPAGNGLYLFAETVASNERQVHSARVNYKTVRVWSAGGTPAENETLLLADLSMQGADIGAPIFGEAAVVIEWECERTNIDGRKVYLRKFIRPGSLIGSMSAAAGRGEDPLTDPMKALFKTYANNVQTVAAPAGVNWQLKSRAGRLPRANNNAVVNDYLRSREFRRN